MSARSAKSHQSSASRSVVWLTPPDIIEALGAFDLDPCAAPEPRPYPTAARMIALPSDGLAARWKGRVWLNPPYGTEPLRRWMGRMAGHGHGTALVPAATETDYWWQSIWPAAFAVMFLGPGRLHYLLPSGHPAAINSGASSVLCAYGLEDADRLAGCGLSGQFVPLRRPRLFVVAMAQMARQSWVKEVLAWMDGREGPVGVDELYRAFAHHPKAQGRAHWRAKLRQTLQRGPFERVGRGMWAVAG